MGIPKQRVFVTITATVVAAVCGALAGYLMGVALTLRHAESKLDQYALRIRQEAETSAAEARSILVLFNASPYAYCSDEEIARFRKLIFQSEYLKDGGRMRDGRIDCSTTLGRANQSGARFEPDISRQDGTRVYRNLAPFRIGDQTVIAVQLGNSFIVYNPYNVKDMGSAFMHFTVSDRDVTSGQVSRLLGEVSTAHGSVLTTEGEARAGDTLYATRCSIRYSACMTAYATMTEALQANRGEFRSYMALGGLSGAVFGLICSILYRRNKGIERQLRRAIRRDALRVVYQPIVELASRRTVGAEALVRWTDEEGFAVNPEVFVKIAEERGFVGGITELVVRHALHSFSETLRSNADFRLSINIAADDLKDPAFLIMLKRSLEREAVSAESLALEITESSTARHEVAIEAIRELRLRGHAVHIDDFGTGYSSLSYLQDLAVDAIKIDRSFTRAIGTEAVTVAILPQILSLASALNLQVIVEGIETELQAAYFADSGRRILAQGWLFGRPVPAEAFLRCSVDEEQEIPVPVDSL
ncbi:MAG: EAL domain-containing protein [Terracidiphilus sp.]|jgi:sensor c-di-GMP phosphodiesterase-like protein